MYLPIQNDRRLPKTAFTAGGGEALGLLVLTNRQKADVLIVGEGHTTGAERSHAWVDGEVDLASRGNGLAVPRW